MGKILKRVWTKESAISYLMGTGDDVIITDSSIRVIKGVRGLKACSAMDYLRNYCNFS